MISYEPIRIAELLGLIISATQTFLIFYGIRVMDKNSGMRAIDSERKHEESMVALKELIKRTGG